MFLLVYTETKLGVLDRQEGPLGFSHLFGYRSKSLKYNFILSSHHIRNGSQRFIRT